MKKFFIRKSLTIGLFVITSLVIESYLFLFLGLGLFPEYFMFDLSLILFFSFIIFCLPIGRFQNIFISITVFLQMLLSYINICIYKTLNDIFTFDLLSLVEETARVITFDMLPILPMVFYLGLFGLFLAGLLLLKKIYIRKFKHSDCIKFVIKNIAIVGLTISMVLYSITSEYLIKNSDDEEMYFFSDKALYNTFSSNKQALIKFGTWGFYFEEFFRQFYTIDDTVSYTKAELNAYLNSSEYSPNKLSSFGLCEGQNVIMIMLESFEWFAISPELTPTLYALSKGYDFGTSADNYKNFNFYEFVKEDGDKFTKLLRKDYNYLDGKYTKKEDISLFEDQSLFDNFGYTLVNYYSKSKTDYSETSAILGNYPYNESFTTHGGILGYSSQNLYSNLDYCFSLPNMLKSSNAVNVTKYMHSYNSTFYGRDSLIKQFGFDETKFLDGMTSEIQKGDRLAHIALDSEVMEYYLTSESDDFNFISKDETFFSFFTTVTTHGEYTVNPLLQSHYEFVDSVGFLGKTEGEEGNIVGLNSEQEEAVRTYLASALDTEYMVTLLVKYLMENDLFESTALVLFSDHQSYYNNMDIFYKYAYFSDSEGLYSSPIYWERERVYGEEYGSNSQDRYKVPAFIYSTKLNDQAVGGDLGHYITKLTCAFDLPVTIMNLLGVEYNPAFYLGYPVKCEVYNEQKEAYDELGVPAICSATGGVFDLYINTEEGKTLKYHKSNVVLPEDLTKFSYNVIKYIEKWYKITALYQYDMFIVE